MIIWTRVRKMLFLSIISNSWHKNICSRLPFSLRIWVSTRPRRRKNAPNNLSAIPMDNRQQKCSIPICIVFHLGEGEAFMCKLKKSLQHNENIECHFSLAGVKDCHSGPQPLYKLKKNFSTFHRFLDPRCSLCLNLLIER